MNQLDGLRRYLEAASTLTQVTRGRAEELVRDLVASGELERARAQEWIEDLLKRSREASETLVSTISAEVDHQLGERGFKNLDLDDLAQRVTAIIERAGTAGRSVSMPRVWSRGPDGGAATRDPADQNGKNVKVKSSSGKKKDGSKKSGTKSHKKSDSKKSDKKKSDKKKSESKTSESKTSESEKSSSKKSDGEGTPAADSPPAGSPSGGITSTESSSVNAEVLTERADHGVAT